MKGTSDISGKGNMPGQVDMTSRGSNSVSIIMLIVLGASLIVLGALGIWLYRLYIVTGEYGLLAYFSGMLAIAVFLWLSALLASRLSKKKVVPNVRDALIATLHDPDHRVRAAAAEGLAKVDLEESTDLLEHKDLDAVLIATLHDLDPRVRAVAAEGLAKVDLEESTQHLEHKDLDAVLIAALHDTDPRVRAAAAEGLAKVELEQSSYYHDHDELEDILFARGQKP